MAKKGSSKKAIMRSTVQIMKEKAAARSRQIKKAKANLKKAAAVRKAKLSVVRALNAEPKRFSAEQLAQFKKLILAKRQEALEELDTLKESMMDVTTGEYVSESSTYSLHMEQGTDAMEREKTFLFASRSSKFISQLDEALVRIKEGTYGVCRVCHLLVPKERLEAVPTAQTCAEYKNTNVPCERGKQALARKKGHSSDI